MPKIEFKSNEFTFLTVTIAPCMNEHDPNYQKQVTKDLLLNTLRKFKHTTVCELTEKYNVHYHSIVQGDRYHLVKRIYAMINAYKSIGRLFTANQIDSQKSLDERIEYMKKDFDNTRKYHIVPIIQDDFDLYDSIFQMDKDPILMNIEKSIFQMRMLINEIDEKMKNNGIEL